MAIESPVPNLGHLVAENFTPAHPRRRARGTGVPLNNSEGQYVTHGDAPRPRVDGYEDLEAILVAPLA